MSDSSQSNDPRGAEVICPYCGTSNRPRDLLCSKCGQFLNPDDVPITHLVEPKTQDLSGHTSGSEVFEHNHIVSLHFTQSDVDVSVPVEHSVILGRKVLPDAEGILDLTQFNSFLNGVSRRHCRLQRRGVRLVLTDLGSLNGTFLNGERLRPYDDYILSDGDRLTLGALHMTLSFSDVS